MRDQKTEAYFDQRGAEYPVQRFEYAAQVLARVAREGSELLDVGCGTGNTLEYLRDATGIRHLHGMDLSGSCVERTRARLGCPAWQGSILERSFVDRFEDRFDVIVLAAVLHHLVGATRTASWTMARRALSHCHRMLRRDGHLLVIEPVFEPRWIMTGVFYAKHLVSACTDGRVELLSQANNLGPPVVSFYSETEVEALLRAAGPGSITARHAVAQRPGRLFRAVGIRRREDLTLLFRRH